MRFVAALLLLCPLLAGPASGGPLCVAMWVTAGDATRSVVPDCGDVPVETHCEDRVAGVAGTGTEVRVVACVPF